MTNLELAAVLALVSRRAAIWTHEAIALCAPESQTPDYILKQINDDLGKALKPVASACVSAVPDSAEAPNGQNPLV